MDGCGTLPLERSEICSATVAFCCAFPAAGGRGAVEEKNHLWRVVFEMKKFYS